MPFKLPSRAARIVRLAACVAAAVMVDGALTGLSRLEAAPQADRTLSLYNIHTKDTVTVTYKRRGSYDAAALKTLNWFLRDWRKDTATEMDPAVIDLVWEVHRELGSAKPVHVISAFRSSGTNESLRSSRGGQAKNSQHILGKAMDVHFPDVPVNRLRYSALVRERGGVGYYPTSALPFVHVDTGRVRHWPRLPRQELALLFPSGRSKHMPPDGRPITLADVHAARQANRELAAKVAAFHDLRAAQPTAAAWATQIAAAEPHPVAHQGDRQRTARTEAAPRATYQLASADPAQADRNATALAPPAHPTAPRPAAVRPPSAATVPPMTLAALAPAPRLVNPPKLMNQPLSARLTSQDRGELMQLASLASAPMPVAARRPARDPRPAAGEEYDRGGLGDLLRRALGFATPAAASRPDRQVASLAPDPAVRSDAPAGDAGSAFAAAPEFDDEHPDELFYRPFPIAPYMTASASIDDPALAVLIAPEPEQTITLLDDTNGRQSLDLRPGAQVVRGLWSQAFAGPATAGRSAPTAPTSGMASRRVRTQTR